MTKGVGDSFGTTAKGVRDKVGVVRVAVAIAVGDTVGKGGVAVGAPMHAARIVAKNNMEKKCFIGRSAVPSHKRLANPMGDAIMDY